MFGPVFTLELMRERRRGVYWHLLPWGYAALFAFVVLVVWHDTSPTEGSLHLLSASAFLIPGRVRHVIDQHFLVLFLLTPALTATAALGEEKAKGTLADLFTTSLTSLEIVGGKLMARSLQVVSILLPSLPILFIVGGYAGVPLTFFAALLLVSLLVVVGLSAVGVLCAVVRKHTSAAILTAYALVGVGGLATSMVPLPALNPLATLELASEEVAPRALAQVVGEASAAWLGVAVVCFAVAVWRVRPDGLRQMHGAAWSLSTIRRAVERPPVDDDPIRWKEYQIEGLAVLPLLRRFPRPLGMIAVAGVSTTVTGCSAQLSLVTGPDAFVYQGVLFLLAATLVVTVRAAGAVTGERERDTWESLRLTPLDGREFLTGKLRGIFDAVLPYHAAYSVPAAVLSLVGGPIAFFATIGSLLIAWPLMYYAAGCSLRWSVRARSTWRSLLMALFTVYVMGGFLVFAVFFAGAMVFTVVGMLIASVADSTGGELIFILALFTIPVLGVLMLAAVGHAHLRQAEAHALMPPKVSLNDKSR